LGYLLKNLNSLQTSYGFGNEKLFKFAGSLKSNKIRLEYKKYYKKIDLNNPWRTYFGGELFYNQVLDEKSATNINDTGVTNPSSLIYNVNVNV